MNILKKIKRIFNNKKVNVVTDGNVNVDLGASSVKYYINGTANSFISSVRRIVNTAEIVDQQNVFCVDGVWYAVGETKTPVSSEVRKCKKPDIDVLVLYTLVKEHLDSGHYNINMLLPYTQLADSSELSKRVSGQYRIQTTSGQQYTYTLTVQNVKCEGQMSYHYIKGQDSCTNNCTVIVNVGFSTTDIAIFKGDEQEEPITVQTGTNILMNQYKYKLDAPNTSVLSYRLMNGDTFTREEEKENLRSIEACLVGLTNDLKTVLRFVPRNSKVVLCGGGAIQYGDLIKDKIKFKNTIVLRGDNAVYTDVLGLSVFCSSVHCTNSVRTMFAQECPEERSDSMTECPETQDTVQSCLDISDTVYSGCPEACPEACPDVLDNVVYMCPDVSDSVRGEHDTQSIQDKVNCILDRSQNGETITDLCKEYNINRSTFYEYKRSLVKTK